MAAVAIQQIMTRVATIAAAAILAAFAASFAYVFFTGVAGAVASLRQGVLMAFSDGLVIVAILLHLSPIILGVFLLGSFCLGVPTYLILRRLGRAGPLALAVAGALRTDGRDGLWSLGTIGGFARASGWRCRGANLSDRRRTDAYAASTPAACSAFLRALARTFSLSDFS